MTREEIIEAGEFFAKRICRFSLEQLGSLRCYIEEIRAARLKEDVKAMEELPGCVAELIAPEIIGDVKEGPLPPYTEE